MDQDWHTKLNPKARIAFDNLPYAAVAYWPFVRGDGSAGLQSRVRVWDGVMIVALDYESHQVFVVEQVRQTLQGPVTTIEIPGGGIDPGDTSFIAAEKELHEEAGVVAVGGERDWVRLSPENGFRPIDGLVITEQHGFLVLSGKQTRKPNDEDTGRVLTKSFTELLEFDNENGFYDPMTPYILRRAHDWLAKHRPDLLT